jgi:uncharacterized glyoxalase superfamily protein PhnB
MTDIFPTFRYDDAHRAIDLLVNTFGFTKQAAYEDDEGAILHAELSYGDGTVMLGQNPREPGPDRLEMPTGGGSVYIVVDDPDALYARAQDAGVTIRRELRDEEYGSRGFSAADHEGNIWSFGTYRPQPGS